MVVPTLQHFVHIHQYIVSFYLVYWVTNGTPCPVRMDWDMDLWFVVIWAHHTWCRRWSRSLKYEITPNVSKAQRSFKISGIMCQTIQHHIPEDFLYFSILCISVGTKHSPLFRLSQWTAWLFSLSVIRKIDIRPTKNVDVCLWSSQLADACPCGLWLSARQQRLNANRNDAGK